MSTRCGIGYDLHRLEAGRRLIVGGIELPFDKGPVGHSDGDVLAHAICDALLGAAGIRAGRLLAQVRERGVTPLTADVSEFLKKGGGSVKCMIGDLGIINRDGSWDFLFNFCQSHDRVNNQPGGHQLPYNFETLFNNISNHPQFLKPGYPIASNTMESRSLEGDLSLQSNP